MNYCERNAGTYTSAYHGRVAYDALEFEAVFHLKNRAPLLSRKKAKIRLTTVLVWTLAFAPPVWPALPAPDKMSEAKGLIDARQLDSAEKIIVAAMMTAPQDPDWITLLAQVRLGQNRTQEALKLLADADQIAGITAARAMLISLAESQAGHLDLAEPQLRTAIRLDPFNASAHYFLGRVLYTDNRFDEAIEKRTKPLRWLPALFEPMKIWACAMKESTIWRKRSAGTARRSIGRQPAKLRPSGPCLIWLR